MEMLSHRKIEKNVVNSTAVYGSKYLPLHIVYCWAQEQQWTKHEPYPAGVPKVKEVTIDIAV
jgi:hypothetical protein